MKSMQFQQICYAIKGHSEFALHVSVYGKIFSKKSHKFFIQQMSFQRQKHW